MSEENKIETHECICQKKGFRKFLIVASGTFVGAFLALSLFAALNKPPIPMPIPCPCQYQQTMGHHQFDRRPDFGPQRFDKGPRGDFHKKMDKRHADRQIPPRPEKPEIND